MRYPQDVRKSSLRGDIPRRHVPGEPLRHPPPADLDGISRRDYNPSLCISAVEMQPLGQMLDDLSDLPAALESL